MAAQTLLGELVNALIRRRSSSLDHIQNTTLVGCQSNHFAGNGAAELCAFSKSLSSKRESVCERQWTGIGNTDNLHSKEKLLLGCVLRDNPSLSAQKSTASTPRVLRDFWTHPLSTAGLGFQLPFGRDVTLILSLSKSCACHGGSNNVCVYITELL